MVRPVAHKKVVSPARRCKVPPKNSLERMREGYTTGLRLRRSAQSSDPWNLDSTSRFPNSRFLWNLQCSRFASLPRDEARAHVRFNSLVQWAQRVAPSGIADRQYGQSFVAGGAGGASWLLTRLTNLTMRKTVKATITKLITSLMNAP